MSHRADINGAGRHFADGPEVEDRSAFRFWPPNQFDATEIFGRRKSSHPVELFAKLVSCFCPSSETSIDVLHQTKNRERFYCMFASGHCAAVHLVTVLVTSAIKSFCSRSVKTSDLLIARLPRLFSRGTIWMAILQAIEEVSYGSQASIWKLGCKLLVCP